MGKEWFHLTLYLQFACNHCIMTMFQLIHCIINGINYRMFNGLYQSLQILGRDVFGSTCGDIQLLWQELVVITYSLPPWLPPFLLFISMVPKFIILHLIIPPMRKLSSLLKFPYDHHISFCSSHTPQLHHNSFRSSSHGHNGLGDLTVITKDLLNSGIQSSPGCGW